MKGSIPIGLYIILALNFFISWANAWSSGRAWVEARALGGYIRVLVWCGAIQSAIGFSSVFLFPLIVAANALFPEYFTDAYMGAAVSLWYVFIIFPALGTGLIITIESWIKAYRERSLLNLSVSSYNTLAQIHNTMHAINTLPSALQSAGKVLGSALSGRGDARGKAVLIAVVVVAIALSAGIIVTWTLIYRYAGTVPLPAGRSEMRGTASMTVARSAKG